MNAQENNAHADREPENAGFKLGAFLGSIRQELVDITWISGAELKKNTKVVIATTFAVGFSVYLVDILLKVSLMRFISG